MKHRINLSSQKVALSSLIKNYLIKTLVLVLGILINTSLFAQDTRTIKGTVVDDQDMPVIGATVIVKGTTIGIPTNVDGDFELNVPTDKEILVISFIGMETKEIDISNQSQINVTLESSSVQLEETVVVGYGQQKKESVVGAITQTTGDVLEKSGGVTNVGTALTGKLPGVITYSSTGQPGSEDPKIIIRTQSSWNNSDPLILVDGIERSMSDVDISSVESVSVLKDASATAVYGVRGANGVILITTKRGKQGKANIQVRANATMKIPSKLPEKYDSYDALMLRNQAIEREMGVSPVSWEDYTPMSVINKYRYPADLTEFERYPNVNWEDVLFKDFAMAYNASINVSGGTKFAKYFAAADFINEGDLFKTVDNGQGYDPGFNYNRINVRSNLDFQLTKTTSFSANLFGSNGVQQTPWNFNGNGPWQAAYFTAPDAMQPVYESTGIWGFYFPHDANQPNSVFQLARNGIEKQTQTKITTDFILKQELDFITEGLKFEGSYSIDNTFREVDRGVQDNSFKTVQRMWVDPGNGEIIYDLPIDASTQFDYIDQIIWSTQAGNVSTNSTFRRQYYSLRMNYARDFGKHNVTALALFSREKYAGGSEFSHFREDWVFRSTYNYGGKYFFEVNGAYNGSEKFGPQNRFAFFPSFSGGWMISEESFMESVWFLDMLKVRGSWGRIGDDAVGGRWLYADQWSYGDNSLLGAIASNASPYEYFRNTSIGNPAISWETVEKRNIGADYSFFDGLIAGSFDYFNDNRTDILISGSSRAIPSYFGGSAPTGNLGEVKSSGFELEVRLSKVINQSLRLWANTNFTHATNEVIFADDPELYPDYQKTAGYAINQTSSYIDAGYLASWDDVLGSTNRQINNGVKLAGDYNIVDFNGDGLIDNYDRAPYGYTGVPQNTFSTTIGADWKGLNFSMQFYGVSNVTREVLFPTFYQAKNSAYLEGTYWTVEDGGDVPLPRWIASKGDESRGTRYLYDGSYMRLKTAELGYTFSGGWIQQAGMKACKLYVSGNNLILWTDMPDDRESNFGGGSRTGAYPTMRRVNLGVDITF
ncbi:TonB-dependent receptor [uncultured Draconibacterium sp.]|uniref:SusC/RagA family TonB-linked outer membrane protein n=1 Tax=uncultured Draconibacterium sp. TaxID=1573823 RepID=UPI00260085A4|nr:TonB-dependent receptor [uncultured Draconibacterium sp.]